MTKIAIITDTHLGVRNDGSDFLNLQQQFFSEVFFPTLKDKGVTHIIHGGDLVDRRKFINFKTASELDKHFIEPILEGGYEFHCIAGNHDVYFKDTNEINALKVLYKYAMKPNFQFYWDNPVTIEIDDVSFMLSPWINDTNRESSLKAIAESQAQILIGHFQIAGFEMDGGQICIDGLDKTIFSKFESVWSGHFHHPSEYANIKYLGSPYEMTWSDYNGKRGFHIFDTETRDLTFYQNPFRMFHKIYYDDTELTIDEVQSLDLEVVKGKALKLMVRRKTNPYIFDILLDRIADAGALDVKVIDETMRIVHDEAQIIDEAEDTPTIMKKYVDTIEVKASKERVNDLLQSLYKETFNQ